MDPRSAFIVATVFILMNGAVLGLAHSNLHASLRAASRDWLLGVLLVAGANLLFSQQASHPPQVVLPIANTMAIASCMLFWRAVRRFDNLPDHLWHWWPVPATAAAIWWFAADASAFKLRVVIVTVVSLVFSLAAALSLWRQGGSSPSRARRVLAAIIGVSAAAGVARTLGVVFVDGPTVNSVTTPNAWTQLAAPIVTSALPIMGTTAFLLLCSDRLQQRWEQAATTDELTGIPNRRRILDHAHGRFEAARRMPGTPLAVAVIDIDHFKQVNDRYGHGAGDAALRHIARLLAAHSRGALSLGREGGEEFLAVIENASGRDALVAAERMRAAVETTPLTSPADSGQNSLRLSVSIGVAELRQTDITVEDLIRRADQALYEAKARGRNRVELAAG